MPYVSGKTGTMTFNSVTHAVTNWKLSIKTELVKFATSSSGGWKTGVPGTLDANGSCTIRLQGPLPDKGTSATMVLKHGDYDGTGDRTYTFPAVITDGTIETNIDTGEAIIGTVTFEGVGPVVEANT